MRLFPVVIAVVVVVVAVVAALALITIRTLAKPTEIAQLELRIFSAGSLEKPLRKLADIFEKRTGVKVSIEFSGSVEAIRKIADLGKWCDVLVVADYQLIKLYMYPRYAKWYVAFAANEIVLAFTNKSKYAEELLRDSSKWVEILSRPDVRYGFSNPNRDPCGYRAVAAIALTALYMNNLSILEELVISKIPGSRYELRNGTLYVYIPASFTPRKNLVVRPKSVDLIALLETGELDYAFEYRSVAEQHGLLYIRLPPYANLGNVSWTSFYRRVVVVINMGIPAQREIRMESIVYGVTVPTVAKHRDLALEFVKLLLNETGREVFTELHHPVLEKPLGFGEIPEELRSLVVIIR